MKKMPLLIKINSEHLSQIRESDINIPGRADPFTPENPCCERIKKADYLVLPSIGIARINLNFCPCCGKKIERGRRI